MSDTLLTFETKVTQTRLPSKIDAKYRNAYCKITGRDDGRSVCVNSSCLIYDLWPNLWRSSDGNLSAVCELEARRHCDLTISNSERRPPSWIWPEVNFRNSADSGTHNAPAQWGNARLSYTGLLISQNTSRPRLGRERGRGQGTSVRLRTKKYMTPTRGRGQTLKYEIKLYIV